MTRLSKSLILAVIGGATLAPPFAFAHSGDLLLARLILHNSAEVTLEITADLAANPFLKDSADPAKLLGQALLVSLPSGRSWTIAELGKPSITLQNGFKAPTPVPIAHGPTEQPPELYTASWTWRPSESPIRIEVPKANPQTVVFWHTAADSDAVASGWRMLLAGDSANPIPLPIPPSPFRWNWQAGMAMSIASLGLLIQGNLLVRKIKRKKLS